MYITDIWVIYIFLFEQINLFNFIFVDLFIVYLKGIYKSIQLNTLQGQQITIKNLRARNVEFWLSNFVFLHKEL